MESVNKTISQNWHASSAATNCRCQSVCIVFGPATYRSVVTAGDVVLPAADSGLGAAGGVVCPAADGGVGTGGVVVLPAAHRGRGSGNIVIPPRDEAAVAGVAVLGTDHQVVGACADIGLPRVFVITDDQVTQTRAGIADTATPFIT